jgi:hypothetical protein
MHDQQKNGVLGNQSLGGGAGARRGLLKIQAMENPSKIGGTGNSERRNIAENRL